MRRFRCEVCDAIIPKGELMSAPSPFDPEDIIYGCPQCKSVAGFDEVCDEPGCVKPSSCGFQSEAGYRRTCYDHMLAAQTKEKPQ